MKKSILIASIIIAAAVGGISAGAAVQGGEGPATPDEGRSLPVGSAKILITTTTNVVTDLVQNIGGDRVQVTGLMGPGVDPHLYRPSAGDVKRLQDADLVFYNGLDLEGKMTDIFAKIGRGGTPVWGVSENVPHESLLSLDARGHFDPHIWWDARLWMEAARVVEAALSRHDPEGSETYQNNLEGYILELEELHKYGTDRLGSVPEGQRVLVTAHDAFQYLGRAYGLEEMSIQGWSTDSEAGIREIQNLAGVIADRRINAVFVESSVSPATIEALGAAVRDRGHDIAIGGELFSDAIGGEGTPEGTYTGAFRHNVDTITRALQ